MDKKDIANGIKQLVATVLRVGGSVSIAFGVICVVFGFISYTDPSLLADALPETLLTLLMCTGIATASFTVASKLTPPRQKGKKKNIPTSSASYVDPVTGKKTIDLRGYQQQDEPTAEELERRKRADDKAIQDDFLKRLRVAAGRISDAQLKATLFELEHLSKGIFEQKDKHPSNAAGYRKFTGYYMPTALYLAESYVAADSAETSAPSSGQGDIRRDAKRALTTAKSGFQRIYDNMFEPAVLDIASEAGALEKVLAADGLLGDDLLKH